MKINLNNVATTQAITERKTQSFSTGAAGASKLGTVDRTTLSKPLPAVSSLVTQALQTPAIRQDRVDSLRDAISSGNYKVDNHKITAFLLEDGN